MVRLLLPEAVRPTASRDDIIDIARSLVRPGREVREGAALIVITATGGEPA
jgi:hypothetical protein